MIVDASGGTGTIHQPHMSVQEKNEPERHTLLHTKCTFTKVTILFMHDHYSYLPSCL
jgi:hypothetical protein